MNEIIKQGMNQINKRRVPMFKHEKGFTLIELIMVIVLLALLAIVAVPQFTNLQNEARVAAEQGVVGGVRSGIYTVYAANLAQNVTPAYPATLGGSGACTVAAPCFGNVLQQPVTQDWTWLSATTYRGPSNATNVYTYNPTTGTFTQTTP
jgi:prepilin-type N-terminal cleavage/methylation domain-containing protein